MDLLFNDSSKIKIFSQIQKSLYNLEPNCKEDEIDKIINLIPNSFLTNEEELLIICRIFAYYSRNNRRTIRGNAIKLFEKIMKPIKTNLHDKSIFFWNIFGYLNSFKQWFYEEGLISFDTIIESALLDRNLVVIEYFLPEIIEKVPEIFEKQFKSKIRTQYSEDQINELKELRKKLFKWYRESNDFNDPFYREIEKNPLRLAIKTDSIDQFQLILSNMNLSIDSEITESIIEQPYSSHNKESLIDYAIEYNAIKIFKYLVMNDAKFTIQSSFNSICNQNYEMIHIVESKSEQYFKNSLLSDAIVSWNFEVVKYALDNYDYDFLEDENIEPEKDQLVINIIKYISYSINIEFLETILLPFLLKNPRFVNDNINEILVQTLNDPSLFFIKEFLKYPGIDINYCKNDDTSILVKAIQSKNVDAVELLLKDPNIDINNDYGSSHFTPFIHACIDGSYQKVFKLFFQIPKFDIYKTDSRYNYTCVKLCALKDNFFGLKYIFDQYPDFKEDADFLLISFCLTKNYFLTVKTLLMFYIKKEKSKVEFINMLKSHLSGSNNQDQLNEIINEIMEIKDQ